MGDGRCEEKYESESEGRRCKELLHEGKAKSFVCASFHALRYHYSTPFSLYVYMYTCVHNSLIRYIVRAPFGRRSDCRACSRESSPIGRYENSKHE